MFDSAERPFIRDILSDPESAAPRVAYADWLEQQDDVRARSARLGIELKECERCMFDELSDSDVERLRRKLRNLNLNYSAKARKLLPQFEGVTWRKFEGGVIEQIKIDDVEAFQQHAGEILDLQPIHQFELSDEEPQFDALLATPELARLGALYLGRNYDGPEVAAALAAAPHIANLLRLDLVFTSIEDEGVAHLARAKHLRCRELALERNELTDASVTAICNADHFQELEHLDLGWNEIGPDGLDALATSNLKLHHLSLYSNEKLTAESVANLVDSGRLAEVEWLNLAHCNLPAAACKAIFSAPHPRLARLNLIGNRATQAVLAAAAKCELPELRELRLELQGKVSERTSTAFVGADWMSELEVLRIRDAGGLPAIGQDLAAAPLQRLFELEWHRVAEDPPSQSFVPAIERLGDNESLAQLRRLALRVPLTKAAIKPLAKLTMLKELTLLNDLAKHAEQLKSALPKCSITFVAS